MVWKNNNHWNFALKNKWKALWIALFFVPPLRNLHFLTKHPFLLREINTVQNTPLLICSVWSLPSLQQRWQFITQMTMLEQELSMSWLRAELCFQEGVIFPRNIWKVMFIKHVEKGNKHLILFHSEKQYS